MKLVVLVLFAILALSGYAPVVHGKHEALYSAFSPILKNKAKKRVKELIKSGRLRFGPDMTSEQKAQFAAMMSGSKGPMEGPFSRYIENNDYIINIYIYI
jgi:hypothetical protein